MTQEYLYKQLRVAYNGVDVLGFFECTSGVLEGNILKQYLGNYPTIEEAQKEHPEAEI